MHKFVEVLEREFGISATPRMRRGIDINAGCGQLTASVKKKEETLNIPSLPESTFQPMVGVYEDEAGEDDGDAAVHDLSHGSVVDFSINSDFINLDDEEHEEEFVDPTFEDELELAEADRLLALIKGTTLLLIMPPPQTVSFDMDEAAIQSLLPPTTKMTKITDEDALRKAKRRRKKLLKQMKAILKLKEMEATGKVLNQEQQEKVSKEKEWAMELESVEHNLM